MFNPRKPIGHSSRSCFAREQRGTEGTGAWEKHLKWGISLLQVGKKSLKRDPDQATQCPALKYLFSHQHFQLLAEVSVKLLWWRSGFKGCFKYEKKFCTQKKCKNYRIWLRLAWLCGGTERISSAPSSLNLALFKWAVLKPFEVFSKKAFSKVACLSAVKYKQ